MATVDQELLRVLQEISRKLTSSSGGFGGGSRNRRRDDDDEPSVRDSSSREAKFFKNMTSSISAVADRLEELSRVNKMGYTSKQLKTHDTRERRVSRILQNKQQQFQDILTNASTVVSTHSSRFGGTMEQLSAMMSRVDEQIKSDWGAIEKGYAKNNQLIFKSTSAIKGLLDAAYLENDAHDEFVSKVIKSATELSALTSASKKLKEGHIHSAAELEKEIDEIASSYGVLEKVFKQFNDDDTQITSFIEYLGNASLTGESLSSENQKLLDLLISENAIVEDGNKLKVKDLQLLKEKIKAVKEQTVSLQNSTKGHLEFIKLKGDLKQKLGPVADLVSGKFFTLSVASGLLTEAFSRLWEQFNNLSATGFGLDGIGQYADIVEANIKLGISVEETAKILQQNASIVRRMPDGIASFTNSLNSGQAQLREFGLNSLQSSEAAAGFVNTLMLAGGDVKSRAKLDKSIKSQTTAFSKLFATTGMTIDEFRGLSDELLASESIQMELNGVSQENRDDIIAGHNNLRQSFVNLGMSAKGAQQALLEIQDIKKAKVSERATMAAEAMRAIMLTGGSSQDAMRIRKKILTKQEFDASDLELMQRTRQRADEMKQSSAFGGRENVADIVYEALDKSGFSKAVLLQQNLEKEAKGAITPDDVERMVESSKTPSWMVNVNEYKEAMQQAITNPIVLAIGGLAAGGMALKALPQVKGLASAAGSKIGNLASGVGGAVGAAGLGSSLLNGAKTLLSSPITKTLFKALPIIGLAATAYDLYSDYSESKSQEQKNNTIAQPTSKTASSISNQTNKSTNSSAVKEEESPSISLTASSFEPINAPLTTLNSLMQQNLEAENKQIALLEALVFSNQASIDQLKLIGNPVYDNRYMNTRQAVRN